jgi:hypothetical protein
MESRNLTQALYVDGVLVMTDDTIYAEDIAEYSCGDKVLIAMRHVVLSGPFPGDEEDLQDE